MYLLLSGKLPFLGKTKEDLLKQAGFGVQYNSILMYLSKLDPIWMMVSEECKDLLSRMLTFDYKNRITINLALQHPWFKKETDIRGELGKDLTISLHNLKKFRTQITFQKAVLSYLASQHIGENDEKKLREQFAILDIDKNGYISKDELVIAFEKTYGKNKKALQEADKVMKNLDVNQNGSIDYNGISFYKLTKIRIFNGKFESE